MKLWILRPRPDLPKGFKNPWDPWYDKAFGFVIRAETEAEAREYASNRHVTGDEASEYSEVWLSPDYTYCLELEIEGKVGVIIRDFRSA